MSDETFMREAIALARANVEAGGRPFGAVLVRDGGSWPAASTRSTRPTIPAPTPNCRRSARPVRRSAARVWTVV